MKRLFLAPLALLMLTINSKAANIVGDSTGVPLSSNAYVYPEMKQDGYGYVAGPGLRSWKNPEGYSKTFFLVNQAGKLDLALRLQSQGTSKLAITLNEQTKEVEIPVSKGEVLVPVGVFDVDKPGYFDVTIKALSFTGTYLPSIRELVFTGSSAESVQSNQSVYRGAPATHLSYPVSQNVQIEWFYNEISIPANAQPMHAYYMANGFNGGYFGIQINSKTERRVLFSIWSAFDTQDPKQIPAEYAVKLVKKGDGVTINQFGNEGSGGQSYWKFNWQPETIYKLLVHAQPQGDHTIYSGYFFDPASNKWKLIATWDKAKSGGKYLGGLYSFVENFGDNGQDFFKARYGNQWIRTTTGEWIELNKAKFTTTANPDKHQRYDIGAGIENGMFQMFSGGFREVGNQFKGQLIERPAVGTPPNVDLSKLP
ncbi:DUF3472 domain-containing protein [Chitinophaga skermanii]|nr:DUF3472 domain-containing protein [Chitinophaga skermanii]